MPAPIFADPFRFDGEVVLVTGASRGIGKGVAAALAERGAQVALNARGAEALETAARELRATGAEVIALPGHAARTEDVERLVDATLEHFGRIDVLVNNAATNVAYGPILDVADEAIRKTFETNLFGPLALTRAVVQRDMKQHGGTIVNVASVGGLRTKPGMAAYGASKAALIHFTRSLSRELAPLGIRANAIAPAVIRTSFAAALHADDGVRERAETEAALGRIGEVNEVVGGVIYLASRASSYVTGHCLVIDGGTLA
jgi:NAD(P)-dependent dehydrogenase (short-subunit alcohol dehydrogenase family)